jgi:hypothetical protein
VYPGTCQLKALADPEANCNYNGACASGYCNPSGKCKAAAKTVAEGKTAVTGKEACEKAAKAFQLLNGHGTDYTSATGGTVKGNCLQAAKVGAYIMPFHPDTTPGTAATGTTIPQCGFCSTECIQAAQQVDTECASIVAETTGLPFFEAITRYVSFVSSPLTTKADDPCHNTLYDGKTVGCARQTFRTPDIKNVVGTLPKLMPDADITTWLGTCTVAYGSSGGASAKFAGSVVLVFVAVLSVLA